MLDRIKETSRQYFSRPLPEFRRHFKVDWNDRLIGIRGAKGTGKTTFLLQSLRKLYGETPDAKRVLYISMDHPLLTQVSMLELARQFVQEGGEKIVFDEIHYFPTWTQELKALYDLYPELSIVFSGSSIIELSRAKADLSRRASMYDFPTLSFGEYLNIETGIPMASYSLVELLQHHVEIASSLKTKIKPLAYFEDYMQHGAYPFYREGLAKYYEKLSAVVNHTIDSDLVIVGNLDPRAAIKLKKFISLIATSLPFSPNISKIAQATELSRAAVSEYLEHLQDGAILSLFRQVGSGYKRLSKPEKIFLNNTNLLHAFGLQEVITGTRRETFLAQCLRTKYLVEIPKKGDFFTEGFTFEVGGKKKTRKQIKGLGEAYTVVDDTEVGEKEKIPLWLFGMLHAKSYS